MSSLKFQSRKAIARHPYFRKCFIFLMVTLITSDITLSYLGNYKNYLNSKNGGNIPAYTYIILCPMLFIYSYYVRFFFF